MRRIFYLSIIVLIIGCSPNQSLIKRNQKVDYEKLQQEIQQLTIKHNLKDFNFDAECIYNEGDLSGLLKEIIDKSLPELHLKISERISEDGQQYIATISNQDTSMEITADTYSDWLPDHFFMQIEGIPKHFGSNKIYVMINP
ncbi:MAG: hypothetical protein EOO43_16420, partial [Flavobacterium sp.]